MATIKQELKIERRALELWQEGKSKGLDCCWRWAYAKAWAEHYRERKLLEQKQHERRMIEQGEPLYELF